MIKFNASTILSSALIPWEQLENSAILVTGATGMLGRAIVSTLSDANCLFNLNLTIYAHGRNHNIGSALQRDCNAVFISGDITRLPLLPGCQARIDYIFHCASDTSSVKMIAQPANVIITAVDGTHNVLETARIHDCKSIVYLSSMEVYGRTNVRYVSESDIGFIDLTAPRSSYPESKRLCETLCCAYHSQFGLPVKIARLAQTFGSGAAPDDSRVFAQMARCVINNRDIVLHTDGTSRGNYCETSDAVHALILLLLCGLDGTIYNVANPEASMTIRDMAELVANSIAGGKIRVLTQIPQGECPYPPSSDFILNIDRITELGWSPVFGLADMYRRMIAEWKLL